MVCHVTEEPDLPNEIRIVGNGDVSCGRNVHGSLYQIGVALEALLINSLSMIILHHDCTILLIRTIFFFHINEHHIVICKQNFSIFYINNDRKRGHKRQN